MNKGVKRMLKQWNIKRWFVGLLIAVGVVFALSRQATARPSCTDVWFGRGGTITDCCGTWDENVSDYTGQDNCWSCQIFMITFNAGNKLAGQVNKALSDPIKKLVAIGAGLWIAFVSALFLHNYSGPDPREYLTKLGGIFLKLIFAYAILDGGCEFVFEYILNPVLSSGVRLANEMISLTNSGITVSMPTDVEGSFDNGPVSSDVADALKSMIEAIASSMAESQAISKGLHCGARFWWKFPVLIEFYVFNPFMWFVGALFGCLFWGIGILFSFAMLDVIFRLGLLIGLLPVFVAAWVFPMFSSYAKTAWDMFLNTVLVFFITGITASFIVLLTEGAWDSNGGNVNEFMDKMKAGDYPEAWDTIFQDGFFGGIGSLFVVLCVIHWGWMMAPKADGTAKKMLPGTSFSSPCAMKAIKKILQIIIWIIEAIIAVITAGVSSFTYVVDFLQYLEQAGEEIQKIREFIEKVKEKKRRLEEFKKKHRLLVAAAKGAKTAAGNAMEKAKSADFLAGDD